MCDEDYRILSHHFRKLTKQELLKGYYPCLKNPDNNKSGNTVPLPDQRFRFSILPRPRIAAGNGHRDFNIGRLEILFFVAGELKGQDFSEGFLTPKSTRFKPAYRLCIGCFPSLYLQSLNNKRSIKYIYGLYYNFARDLNNCMITSWPSFQEQLFDGDYCGVVKASMPIVEYCLEQMIGKASSVFPKAH